jgi:predicted Zn-dependent protease
VILLLPVLLAGAEQGGLDVAASNPEVRGPLQAASAALRAGRTDEALRLFRRALSLEPGNQAAKYGISMTLIQQNSIPEAQAVLESLITQFPDDYVLKNNAAWLYATSTNRAFRNPDHAVTLAREALLKAPEDFHVWSTLAAAHYAQGDFDKSVRIAQQALEMAAARGLPPDQLKTYREQLDKARQAQRAFSLVE